MKNTSCPDCNCSGHYIMPSDENGKVIRGKAFCWECQDFVKLVPAGTKWRKLREKHGVKAPASNSKDVRENGK